MLLVYVLCLLTVSIACDARPNIVVILIDDLGWNDVAFHGSGQVPTPNIDAVATSGLLLHNYYVTPLCTPSRSAFMTGKYPIHTGMQHGVLYGTERRGLPLSEKILPQYLRELGYRTHLVGKWHLGSYKKEYLPLNRGFESHLGYWTGKIDMYDHTTDERGTWGFDFRRGFKVAHDLFGKYATDVYTEESVKIIRAHNKSEPLFLMLAHTAVHSGNAYEFIRAPDHIVAKFDNITDIQRRKFAAVMAKVDESVGKVVSALQEEGLLENSIILFSTDNGGPAGGFNSNAASNYPLRGVKNTLWEGGVRGAAALWTPWLEKRSRVASQMMHIADWLPTFYRAAGGNVSSIPNLDGVDQWDALSKDEPSPRSRVLHNIDDVEGVAAITVDNWKLLKGATYKGQWDFWYGPSGRDAKYDAHLVASRRAGKAFKELGLMPSEDKIVELRNAATIECGSEEPIFCEPLLAPCLFDVVNDPCEMRNLADQKPEILQAMLDELDRVNKTAVPALLLNVDPRGDPKYWSRVYTNFGDFEPPRTMSHCS